MANNTEITHLYVVTEAAQVIPVIQYEDGDELIHTDEHPNCEDDTCPCNANVVPSTLVSLIS